MHLSKNKKHQYFFFLILSIYTIFNGGNSNLLIQVNFILVSLLFLSCLKDRNYNLHLRAFYRKNKFSIFFYILFLIYLIFQIVPLHIEHLKFFSPFKYEYISLLDSNIVYSAISLAPSNSYFQILNSISLLIIVLIIKMIFYTDKHKYRFYLFLSLLGFILALFAILFYFIGNPDFFIFKNSFYPSSSTGFFVNRTVFAISLVFSLIASLEFLKYLNSKEKNITQENFFLKIYIRFFIIFITIGVITSFSRIGNFLLLITILSYLINEHFFSKNENKSFKYTLLLIILFDILIFGFYFGSIELVSRFYFLKDDFFEITSIEQNYNRFQIIKFSFNQLYNFIFFGFGSGCFETLFQINFSSSGSSYANHAHSDILEFIGEFGFIGFAILVLSLFPFFFDKKNYNLVNSIIMTYLFIILIFDFSLHVPLIQILFVSFLVLNKKKLFS